VNEINVAHVNIPFRNLASTMRALSSAQQPIVDETNNEWMENDEALNVERDRYQIVNSCLAAHGDYHMEKCMSSQIGDIA
jgi:hypothetical protein